MTCAAKFSKPFGGSVTTFIRKHGQSSRTGTNNNVPCNGCTACCRSPNNAPELTPHELARFRDAAEFRDGHWLLARHENGHCIKLVDGKCSIYSDRPKICALFDCRFYALLGLVPGNDAIMAEAIEQWAPPDMPRKDDVRVFQALRAAVFDGGPPSNNAAAVAKASRWRQYLGNEH
jgi:hypothetical protein